MSFSAGQNWNIAFHAMLDLTNVRRSERKMTDPIHQTPEEKNTDTVPQDTPFAAENTCRRCKGTGKIDGNRCPDCHGGGKVITPVGGAG